MCGEVLWVCLWRGRQKSMKVLFGNPRWDLTDTFLPESAGDSAGDGVYLASACIWFTLQATKTEYNSIYSGHFIKYTNVI